MQPSDFADDVSIESQIDENLHRAFPIRDEARLPDRFHKLLTALRDKDLQRNAASQDA